MSNVAVLLLECISLSITGYSYPSSYGLSAYERKFEFRSPLPRPTYVLPGENSLRINEKTGVMANSVARPVYVPKAGPVVTARMLPSNGNIAISQYGNPANNSIYDSSPAKKSLPVILTGFHTTQDAEDGEDTPDYIQTTLGLRPAIKVIRAVQLPR
ncbi:MAG: hypothetical protein R3B84_06240 [Zavarzinella sp.]